MEEELQKDEEKPQEEPQEEQFEEVDVGDELLSWETWDNPPAERSRLWYVVMGSIGVALTVYAVLAANYLFAIIILIIAVIIVVNSLRPSRQIKVYITSLGIVFGDEFYPYQEIKDFSIIYQPPEVQILYIDFHKIWRPLITIQIGDVDPNVLRSTLLPFVFENLEREDEHLTDAVKRMYKL
ncbi:MAG: hypothetical protein WC776_05205 [Patescibacteria group bacterium]|jgi:hypothetical protein